MMSLEFNKLNNVKEELAELKKLFNSPSTCLKISFSEMKADVDVSFARKSQAINDPEYREVLKENWSFMIKKINLFEKECNYMLKINKPCENDSKKMRMKIEEFDQKIIKFQDYTKQLERIEELIQDEIHNLEKLIYLNRTYIFLARYIEHIKLKQKKYFYIN